MSKFTATVILGLALFAYIDAAHFPEEEDSQLAIKTDDSSEIAALDGTPLSVFNDFCLATRDYVYGDIKNNANNLSSRVYGMFFNSVQSVGNDALGVSRLGAERLGAQLVNPDAPIAEPTNEAERIIAEGQRNIQATQTQPKALIEAFKSTIAAAAQNGYNQLAQKMEGLKKLADVGTVISTLQTVCSSIEGYENANQEKFEQVKAELVESNPELASVRFSQVPCVTTRRVSRLDSVCKLVVSAKDPLQKMASTFSRSQ